MSLYKSPSFSSVIFLLSVLILAAGLCLYIWSQRITDYGIPIRFQSFNKSPKALEILSDFSGFRDELIFSSANWIEVNLEKMILRVYNKDNILGDYPILRRGSPEKWGGTASGLNKVNYKSDKWFSNTALVFMPNALNFYGKYYIHGEPFYPDGRKLITVNSGGCIQIRADQAKIIYDLVQKGTPVLVIDKENDGFEYPVKRTTSFPEISAKSYLVADLGSGTILAQDNYGKRMPIYDITQLMAGLVLSENVDLNSEIDITARILDPEKPVPGLEIGRRFMLGELFYPILMESSESANKVLAAYLGRANTLKYMNQKTAMMAMFDTSFIDTAGKEADNISSAKDLFYLARYITDNIPLMWKMTKGQEVLSLPKINFSSLSNENIFYKNPDFIGGKVGFNNALFIFRVFLEANVQRKIAIILLGSDDLEGETNKILGWISGNYFKTEGQE
ncbi:MAG: L,D-transpeptidase family protein [bacterium]|nr:L,D-transpeptidase family protein [bacterium]